MAQASKNVYFQNTYSKKVKALMHSKGSTYIFCYQSFFFIYHIDVSMSCVVALPICVFTTSSVSDEKGNMLQVFPSLVKGPTSARFPTLCT